MGAVGAGGGKRWRVGGGGDKCVLPLIAGIDLSPACAAAVAGSVRQPPKLLACAMSARLCLTFACLLVLCKSGGRLLTPDLRGFLSLAMSDIEDYHLYAS